MNNIGVKSGFKSSEDLTEILNETAKKLKLWLVANPYSLPFKDYLSRLTNIDVREGLQETPVRFHFSPNMAADVKDYPVTLRNDGGRKGKNGTIKGYGVDALPVDMLQDNMRVIHTTDDYIVLFNSFIPLYGCEDIDDRILASFTIFPKVLVYETLSNGLSFRTARDSEILEEHAYALIADHSHVAYIDVLSNESWIPSNASSKHNLLQSERPKAMYSNQTYRLFDHIEKPRPYDMKYIPVNYGKTPQLFEVQMYFFDVERYGHNIDIHNIIFAMVGEDTYNTMVLDREALTYSTTPTHGHSLLDWSMMYNTNTTTKDTLDAIYTQREIDKNLPEGLMRYYTFSSMNSVLRNIAIQKIELMELVSAIAQFMNTVLVNFINDTVNISREEDIKNVRVIFDHNSIEFKNGFDITTSMFSESFIKCPELWDDHIIPMLKDKPAVMAYFMGKIHETD